MGDLILWFPPSPTTTAIGQGRLIYFCWASLGKHSHIPLILLSVGRGLPPSLGPAFPRIQSPCGGSPAWGGNALLTRWPLSQAVREQSVSQLRWGMGWGVLEPFQSPLGTKSKDTHTEAKVGASRESQAQVGVGREAKDAPREHCSCPGGCQAALPPASTLL